MTFRFIVNLSNCSSTPHRARRSRQCPWSDRSRNRQGILQSSVGPASGHPRFECLEEFRRRIAYESALQTKRDRRRILSARGD